MVRLLNQERLILRHAPRVRRDGQLRNLVSSRLSSSGVEN